MGATGRGMDRGAIVWWCGRIGALVTAVLLAVSIGAAAAAAAPQPAGRFEELSVPSSMGPIPVQVRWAAHGGSAALYVLDGLRAPADHNQWTSDTNILRQFADDNVTLVFPVGGHSSFYTDWHRPSSTNHQATTYRWETFLTRELPAFLQGYGVSRTDDAIVGASMGGDAALILAAYHRDQFRFAGSFSGFLNPTFPLWGEAMRAAMWNEGGFNVDDMWGPRSDPAWVRNDATVQAGRLRGLPIYVSSGNGLPGPLDLADGLGNTVGGMGLEAMTMTAARMFADRVAALGIPARIDIGAGTHTWPYWQGNMATARPMILAALGVR